jgi:hypothetical protein
MMDEITIMITLRRHHRRGIHHPHTSIFSATNTSTVSITKL